MHVLITLSCIDGRATNDISEDAILRADMRKAREDIGIALLANSGIFVPLAKCSSIYSYSGIMSCNDMHIIMHVISVMLSGFN